MRSSIVVWLILLLKSSATRTQLILWTMATDVLLETTMVSIPSHVKCTLTFFLGCYHCWIIQWPCSKNVQKLRNPGSTRLLQQCHISPYHSRLYDTRRWPNRNRPWWILNLRREVRRWNQIDVEAHRRRYLEHGQQWAKHEWKSILHHIGTNSLAGWKAYNIWTCQEWHEDCSKNGVDQDKQRRQTIGWGQDRQGQHYWERKWVNMQSPAVDYWKNTDLNRHPLGNEGHLCKHADTLGTGEKRPRSITSYLPE